MSLPDPPSEPPPTSLSSPGRRVPSTLGGLAYLVVCALTAIGLLVVAFGPWRRGVTLLGAALLFAGAVRLALSEHDAGMLRVRRHRVIDAAMLVGVGSALITLAQVIPDQPG